jgi:hypothetical protein
VAIAASSLVHCQIVAGVESRSVDPVPPEGCAPFVVTDNDPQLRIANLAPGGAPIDACVTPSGTPYFRPILRDRGASGACRSGVAYPTVTARLPAPSSAVDVKLIAAGGTCDAPALAELTEVPTTQGASVTVVLYTDAMGQLQATSRADDRLTVTSGDTYLRFGDFQVGSSALTVGAVTGDRLPQTLGDTILDDIPFGAFTPGGAPSLAGPVDANGFLDTTSVAIALGVAEHGSADARFVVDVPLAAGTLSVFAIGSTTDATHPPRGLLCQDDQTTADGLFTACTPTDLAALVFDTWDPDLLGAFAADEDARRPYILEQIATRNADVICLSDVDRDTDRAAIIEAAKAGGFAYSMTLTTDETTPATDPTDANGMTPSAPTVAPCGGTVDPAAVAKAYACATASCSDPTTGEITGGADCLSTNCLAPLLPLYAGDLQDKKCFDCILTRAVSYVPFTTAQTRCTTEVGNPFAFEGQTPAVILSKHPLLNTDAYVMPTTYWRRAFLYAQVQIDPDPSKPPLDYFCGQFTAYITQMPYTGPYSTQTGIQGWADEETLGTAKLIAWAQQKSAGRPAVLSADWNTSAADPAAGLAAQNQPATDLLDAAFTLALPAGFTPQCTYCAAPENPYNGTAPSVWLLRTYLANFPPDATQSAALFFTDSPVPLPTGGAGPLSNEFGWSVGVLRP